jgi:hypothetical protein
MSNKGLPSGLTVLLSALVAANGLLFAWGQGWLGGQPGSTQREPARLAAQVSPERLQLLSPEAASAAKRPLQCREIGAFSDEAGLQAAETALQEQMGLLPGQWQRQERRLPGQWILATRAADHASDLARKRTTLERADVKPLRSQNLLGESEASWLLGRYDSVEAVQAEQARLREKGLRLLRIVPMRLPSSSQWLRLPALTEVQLKASHPAWPGGLRPCATPTAPAALASAPVTATSAASAPASAPEAAASR